jgi:lysozyme family protein
MAASSYDDALARVLVHEGGNDDDPRDPGGRTSRGILQNEWDVWRKTHPGLPADVWQAPQKEIEAIYRQKYWDVLRCDELPAGVDYAVFDYGVNSGIGRSARVLQRLIGVDVDGEIGPNTIAAAKRAKASQLIDGICDERLAFLRGLRTWPTFGKGWGRRVRDVRTAAQAMAAKPAATLASVSNRDALAAAASSSTNWVAWLGNAIFHLFKPAAAPAKASSPGTSAAKPAHPHLVDTRPPWLAKAESYLGFHERPNNRASRNSSV